MKTLASFIFLVLLATRSQAFQPCPMVQVGWAQSYAAPITSMSYDQATTLLYVIWRSTFPTVYVGVPVTMMSTLSKYKDPVLAYNQYIVNRYPSLLLQEINDCPILNENGQYISTNGLSLNPIPPQKLLQENGGLIFQENQQPILLWTY